jgi:DNA-binding NarL/FixJ family response regulator
MAETDTPQAQDVPGEFVLYDKKMTRVYIADPLPHERSALRIVLLDLHMEVIGEAANWTTTLAQAPALRPDMVLIDWSTLPSSAQNASLAALRDVCPKALMIVLISHLDARQLAVLSSGADTFISKGEAPDRVTERLLAAAQTIVSRDVNLL